MIAAIPVRDSNSKTCFFFEAFWVLEGSYNDMNTELLGLAFTASHLPQVANASPRQAVASAFSLHNLIVPKDDDWFSEYRISDVKD